MPFDLPDLDARTRELMLEELESDAAVSAVYRSAIALPGTDGLYLDAQRRAFASGDTDSLRAELAGSRMFAPTNKRGATVNVQASADALADGQFIAYYARAICRRALEEGRQIEVYRGQMTVNHRPESDAAIGSRPDPSALLAELRSASANPFGLTLFKINSGLSVELV